MQLVNIIKVVKIIQAKESKKYESLALIQTFSSLAYVTSRVNFFCTFLVFYLFKKNF